MSAVLDEQQAETEEVVEVITDAEVEVASEEAETSEELIVTIGDEVSPTSEDEEKVNPWEKVRELAKEKKALEKKLKSFVVPEPEATKPGDKPTLENCDYDETKFEEGLTKWYEQTQEYSKAQTEVKAKEQEAQQTWQGHLDRYNTGKAELKLDPEVEQVVLDELSETQQGLLVQYTNDSAKMVLALAKNPQKAKELASIKDPIRFAIAITEMEKITKVTKRMPPKPETQLDVARSSGGGGDKQLDKLREEGDIKKIMAYRRANNSLE